MSKPLLWVACAAVLLAFWAGRRSADQSATVEALRARNDSLTRTAPAFQHAQMVVDTVVVRERASATAALRVADSLRRVADSLRMASAAPQRPVEASDTSGATGGHPTEAEALRGALAAQMEATAALTVALDTMTAARDSALRRLAVAQEVAHQGLTVAEGTTTWRLGPLRLPRVPKWVAAVVGCSGGAYLDRQEPFRGCGLAATGLLLVLPTR